MLQPLCADGCAGGAVHTAENIQLHHNNIAMGLAYRLRLGHHNDRKVVT